MKRTVMVLAPILLVVAAIATGAMQTASPEPPATQPPADGRLGGGVGFVDVGDRVVNRSDIIWIEHGEAVGIGGRTVRVQLRGGRAFDGKRSYWDVRNDLLGRDDPEPTSEERP